MCKHKINYTKPNMAKCYSGKRQKGLKDIFYGNSLPAEVGGGERKLHQA